MSALRSNVRISGTGYVPHKEYEGVIDGLGDLIAEHATVYEAGEIGDDDYSFVVILDQQPDPRDNPRPVDLWDAHKILQNIANEIESNGQINLTVSFSKPIEGN